MKTIKLYITSHEELSLDKAVIGNLVRQLNIANKPFGIALELVDAEDSDIEEAARSDMFVALFHTESDRFSFDGVQRAVDSFKENSRPKVFVFFKDMKEEEKLDDELAIFKNHLCNDLGHYTDRYGTEDGIRFSIVMKVMQIEGAAKAELQGSHIIVGTEQIADVDNLSFISKNKEYIRLKESISLAEADIERLKQAHRENPDDEEAEDRYFAAKSEKYKYVKELEECEKALFSTALSLSKIAGERYSERIAKALDLFQQGRTSEADDILNAEEMKSEAERELASFEQGRSNLETIIAEFRMKADTSLANFELTPEDRLSNAEAAYEEAIRIAETIKWDDEKYSKLMFDFSDMLCRHARYDKSLLYGERVIKIREEVFGENHCDTATSYNLVGKIYLAQDEYGKAYEFFQKAFDARLAIFGENHPDTAKSLANFGVLYFAMGEYDKSLEYLQRALKVFLDTYGENHHDTAQQYCNIAAAYGSICAYDKSLEYCKKALKVYLATYGENHPDTANAYDNIGTQYYVQGAYDKSLEYYQKALRVYLATFGESHPYTANTFNRIGMLYGSKCAYDKSLEYCKKALKVYLATYGENHSATANAYNNIGIVLYDKGDYGKALEYYQKALNIRLSILGESHPDTASAYNNIGAVLHDKGDYGKALEYYQKALNIRLSILGESHPDTAYAYNNIGVVHHDQGDYGKALDYYQKALDIRLSIYGENHPDTAYTYNKIGCAYLEMGNSSLAVSNLTVAKQIYHLLGYEEMEQDVERMIENENIASRGYKISSPLKSKNIFRFWRKQK